MWGKKDTLYFTGKEKLESYTLKNVYRFKITFDERVTYCKKGTA